MIADKYLTYRGEIRGAVGVGATLAFVTVHPEGSAHRPLPTRRGQADAGCRPPAQRGYSPPAAGETLWVAGNDARIYEAVDRPRAIRSRLASCSTAPALPWPRWRTDGCGALIGSRVVIINTKDGKRVQTLELPEPGHAWRSTRPAVGWPSG